MLLGLVRIGANPSSSPETAPLQFAHEEGVVHRDIKPENVLLDKKGRVKIADFGLAKLLGRSTAGGQLTISHQVMGTMHYMAPEQLEKPLEVDHRADIYSLGVVFYELLTGALPIGRFPLPSEALQTDARLDAVVLKAIEREPDRRYQQASYVKTDIESLSSETHASSLPERSRGAAHGDSGWKATAHAGRPWPIITLVTAGLAMLLTFVPWRVASEARMKLHNRVDLEVLQAGLETSYDLGTVRSIGHWDSSLDLSLAEVSAVIPNWFVFVAALLIAGVAIVRGVSGKAWTLPAQFVLALYGVVHTFLLLVVMADLGMTVQAATVLLLVGFIVLLLVSPLFGCQWMVRVALSQPHTVQLKIASVGIMLVAGGVFVFLAVNFIILAVMVARGEYTGTAPHELPLVFVALLAAILLLSGFVLYGGWSMFRRDSYLTARLAAIFGQPFGLWGLWLLTRPEVKAAFHNSERNDAHAKPAANLAATRRGRYDWIQSPRPTVLDKPLSEADHLRVQRMVNGPAIGLFIVAFVSLLPIVLAILVFVYRYMFVSYGG